jgi:hypothetical protein
MALGDRAYRRRRDGLEELRGKKGQAGKKRRARLGGGELSSASAER